MKHGNNIECKTDQVWSSPRLMQLGHAVESEAGKASGLVEAATPVTLLNYLPSGPG